MKKSHGIPRWWDWTAIILLFLMLETLASRLVNTSWTPFLYMIQVFTSQGVVIGLILGYSQFKRGTTSWVSLFYMLILLPLQWTLIIDQRVSLEEQFASLWGRLYYSVSELIAQRPVEDPIFFVAVMSIAFWVVSASSGFSLTRYQNYLRAVVPSAIGILVIQHYDNTVSERIWGLGIFTFLSLLLLGRLYYLQNKDSWRSRRIFISAENSLDLAGGMAILAGLIIVTSFIVPASRSGVDSAIKTWNRVTQPWHEFTEKLENAVSAVDSPGGGAPGEFYGTELKLGRGFPLSEAVMFKVDVPGLPDEAAPPRYYWRGRVYDFFTAGQWYMTKTTREKFSPLSGGPTLPNTEERDPQKFSFTVGDSRFSLLYAPSQTVWFSRPGSFLAAPAGIDKDIFSWNASPALLPGETYQAQAVLSDPNTKQLREAGTDYPQWVTDTYLQLPATFSPRIAELAQTIAADQDNSYDKTVAITNYLRQTIEYSETIPAAPRKSDPLEWVLFDYKKGYCVYYATSEVLMLRSLGIPARLAVGFSQGEPTITRDNADHVTLTTFTVLKKNAHAWPEVYFPDIGWVEFEPTGNQLALTRPLPPVDPLDETDLPGPATELRTEDETDFAGRNAVDDPGVTDIPEPTVNSSLYLIPLLIVFVVLVAFFGRRYNLPARIPVFIRTTMERNGGRAPIWVVRWEYWSLLSPIEKSFESINFGLRLMKKPAPIHSTPAERADSLSNTLPQLAEPIKILLDEHQTSLYTSRTADVNRARHSAFNIRLQSIVARIRRFFTGNHAIHS
jgi:transglutaminase-like putative cysteine protease